MSDGLEGMVWVCVCERESRACNVMFVLARVYLSMRVRDTGQHCDMSRWQTVKASWQHVVTLVSGSHSGLSFQDSKPESGFLK